MGRAGPLGQGEAGALCRRFCGAGATAEPEIGGLDRGEVGDLDGTGDQPGKDARGGVEAGRSEPGLSGIHVSVGPEPNRAGTLLERVSIGQEPRARAGQAEGDDQRTQQLLADTDGDSTTEPAPERLGQLLSFWLSERGFCPDQPLRTSPSLAAPEETQPATVSDSPGSQRVPALSTAGLATPAGDGGATACEAEGDTFGESRMREIRTSGLTREEAHGVHGMRLVRHIRGNPDTEYVEA